MTPIDQCIGLSDEAREKLKRLRVVTSEDLIARCEDVDECEALARYIGLAPEALEAACETERERIGFTLVKHDVGFGTDLDKKS